MWGGGGGGRLAEWATRIGNKSACICPGPNWVISPVCTVFRIVVGVETKKGMVLFGRRGGKGQGEWTGRGWKPVGILPGPCHLHTGSFCSRTWTLGIEFMLVLAYLNVI